MAGEPGSDFETLPDDWTVWSDDRDGRTVLAYRPDVFDADAFPAPCLPTLYLTHGKRSRRPGQNPNDRVGTADWHVTLYLEPEVYLRDGGNERFPAREEAVEYALELATAFANGEIDYRACYQVPRETYLDRLDELTGREDRSDGDAANA